MGDRGNIVMRYNSDPKQDVYFYTHWSGSQIPRILQTALGRRLRWDDPAYLARIIFCTLVKGREGEETGFGIATTPCDNEHDYLVVDLETARVTRVSRKADMVCDGEIVGGPWTYEEFLGLNVKDWDKEE